MKDIVHGSLLVESIFEITFEKVEKFVYENCIFWRGCGYSHTPGTLRVKHQGAVNSMSLWKLCFKINFKYINQDRHWNSPSLNIAIFLTSFLKTKKETCFLRKKQFFIPCDFFSLSFFIFFEKGLGIKKCLFIKN